MDLSKAQVIPEQCSKSVLKERQIVLVEAHQKVSSLESEMAAEKASEMFLSVGSHLMRWLEPDLSHKRWVQEMDSTSQPLATIKPRNHCHYFIASRVNRPPSEHEKETSNCNSI